MVFNIENMSLMTARALYIHRELETLDLVVGRY